MTDDLKRFYRAGWVIIYLCLSSGVFANPGHISEFDLLSEIPTVNIVSRMDQPVNLAPASVTVINRELIDASGAQNWGDLFRLVPGFQSYAVNDNRPGIAYHGFGDEFPNRMEVMIDGRSVYEPVFSTVLWGMFGIQLEDVDHIEIVRGSSAATHGSNAFLGAVNIVTREPTQDKGTTVKVTGGSRETLNSWVRINDSLGPLNYRLSLGSRHNDGFPSIPEGELDDGRELYQIAFRGTITPSLNDVLDLNFAYANDRVGLGDADHPDEFIDADYYSSYQSVEWRHSLLAGGEFSVHGYHNKLRASNSADRGLLSDILDVDPALVALFLGVPDQPFAGGLGSLASERFDLEFEHQFSMVDRLRTVWGLGGRSEYAQSQFLQGRGDKIWEESFRWFTHNEWRPSDEWMLNVGLMVEKTFVGTLLSPRLSLSRLFSPHHTVRMSISRGTRAPSITEANLDQKLELSGIVFDAFVRSDERLEEEEVTSFELGWAGYFPQWQLGADLNVFREQARHAMDDYEEVLAVPTPIGDDQIKVRSNTGEWESVGAELQVTYRPVTKALVRAHYAYTDLDSDFVRQIDPEIQIGDFNQSRPRHSGGLLLNYQWTPQWATGLTLYHQGEVKWRDGNFIDEYTRLDSHITFKFVLGNNTAQLQLVAQNITEDYPEFNEENIFGSRYFVSFSVDLP